jgi:hypothetical protein
MRPIARYVVYMLFIGFPSFLCCKCGAGPELAMLLLYVSPDNSVVVCFYSMFYVISELAMLCCMLNCMCGKLIRQLIKVNFQN